MRPMGAYKKVRANMATLEKISPGPSGHHISRFGQQPFENWQWATLHDSRRLKATEI